MNKKQKKELDSLKKAVKEQVKKNTQQDESQSLLASPGPGTSRTPPMIAVTLHPQPISGVLSAGILARICSGQRPKEREKAKEKEKERKRQLTSSIWMLMTII